MIPVENISSSTMGNLLYYVAIVGLLLVVATLIRLKVPLLRKAFIPASLLAGLIGLALGPYALGVIPQDMMSSIGTLPTHMITVVFACMLLGVKKQESGKEVFHDAAAGLGWLWSNSFMQVGVASLLCAVLFTPVFGVNPLFGSLFEIGFAGGHGTAGGMASVFKEQLNWADGADLAMTTATIGLLCGIFGGMIIINYGVRKKYTKVLTEPATGGTTKEVFPEGAREPAAHMTISQDVVEPFAFHLGIIGISILIGRIIVWGFAQIFGYSGLPLFPFAMIGGWLLNAITLLRIVDPEAKSGTLSDYGYSYTLQSVIEVFIIALVPIMAVSYGCIATGAVLTVIALALFLTGAKVFGVHNQKMDELREGEAEIIATITNN